MCGIALAFAACSAAPLPGADSGCPSPPMDMTVGDRALELPIDLARAPGTGDPCSRETDCPPGADGRAFCVTLTGSLAWPDGYCSSTCQLSRNDPSSGINPECPGGSGTCVVVDADAGTGGQCLRLCASNLDCSGVRFQYECTLVSGAPSLCVPSSEIRECNPQQLASCGPGKTCTDFFCDTSESTRCAQACDPLLPPSGCNCQRNYHGEGFCTAVVDLGAGAPCRAAGCLAYGVCPSGYGCLLSTWKCWKYCTPQNVSTQCGPCARCEEVKNGVGVCSTSS